MTDQPLTAATEVVRGFVQLLKAPITAPDVAPIEISTNIPARDTSRPCALLLSPHPDDECLTGILPLRLLCELNWQIINVAITLGGNKSHRARRKAELAKACAVLGFSAVLPEEDGFSDINPEARENYPEDWRKKAESLADIISACSPQAIFMPHAHDWNATHEEVHLLGREALSAMPQNFACRLIETEYWQPMVEPNLMIGATETDVAILLSALACHVGEVTRNPYDRRFPSFLIDNVRRGSERLSGKGASAADMDFAMMYRIGVWRNGKYAPSALNRFVSAKESLNDIFE